MAALGPFPSNGLAALGRRSPWALIVAFACFFAPCARAQESLAAAVKAAYLSKFAPFVSWPAGAFSGYSGPFTICVVGADPFGPVLDRVVAGQSVDGKPVVVRRMAKADRDAVCQVLFAAGSSAQVKDTLHAVEDQPVLTVTDGSGAAGVVDFVIEGGKVRFRLDDAAAAQKNLVISSKLLSLAATVKRRPAEGGPK